MIVRRHGIDMDDHQLFALKDIKSYLMDASESDTPEKTERLVRKAWVCFTEEIDPQPRKTTFGPLLAGFETLNIALDE